jgi:hypothetical protein
MREIYRVLQIEKLSRQANLSWVLSNWVSQDFFFFPLSEQLPDWKVMLKVLRYYVSLLKARNMEGTCEVNRGW